MTYNKTNWKTGDVITAKALNNLESGVSNNDTSVTELNEAKAVFAENIINLQTQTSKNTNDISTLKTNVTTNTNDISTLKTSKANQTEVDQIQEDITTLNGDVATVFDDLALTQTDVQSNTENITNLQNALPNKQDKLTAGNNITIDSNNVISATSGGSSEPPTNMVTTDTAQTITGFKTFNGFSNTGLFNIRDISNPSQRFTTNFLNDGVELAIANKNSEELAFGVNTTNAWFKPFYNCSNFYINNYSDNSAENGIAANIILSGVIKNKVNNITSNVLTQKNVTAGDNISITETTNGIQISSTSTGGITIDDVSPDYTAGVDVGGYTTSDNQFTAPCAGIVYFFAGMGGGTGARPKIYINDVLFSDLYAVGSTTTFSVNNGEQFVLGKGDKYYATFVVTGYATGANMFYPLKGANK